jgi:hypothetical protein
MSGNVIIRGVDENGKDVRVKVATDGSLSLADAALAWKLQTDGSYTYFAEAASGAAEADAVWRVTRFTDTRGMWADGNGKFDNVATDLTALSYS